MIFLKRLSLLLFIFIHQSSLAQLVPVAFWKDKHLVTAVISTTGTGTWTAPSNFISLVSVECWGAGGGTARNGVGNSFGGGGGGGYAKRTSITLTPSTAYSYQVGAGGITPNSGDGGNGEDSWFANAGNTVTYAMATGGDGSLDNGSYIGGIAGLGTVGDVIYAGGIGGSAPEKSGGGGGASGSPNGIGPIGSNSSPSKGGDGGRSFYTGSASQGGPLSGANSNGALVSALEYVLSLLLEFSLLVEAAAAAEALT